MKHYVEHKFDQNLAYGQLIKLSSSFVGIGIGLIATFQIGLIFFRSSHVALQNFVFYFLISTSIIGLGCIICGGLLWRSIYGLFPNMKLQRDLTQNRDEPNR
jgi:hypothetical protein